MLNVKILPGIRVKQPVQKDYGKKLWISFFSKFAARLGKIRYILYLGVGGQVFLCPHGQGVGSAPNVHKSPQ